MSQITKLTWVFLIYTMEGLPFGVFADVFPVYFRLSGATLEQVGTLSLLQLPWSLKLLWSPLVDRLGTPRRWLGATLLSLCGLHAVLAWLDASSNRGLGWAMAATLLAVAIAAATQDVAIDGYFVRLMGPGEEGIGNGVRVVAYRCALIAGGGGAVVAGGLFSWAAVFGALAAVYGLLAMAARRAPLPPPLPMQSLQQWGTSLWAWIRQKNGPAVFLFVLLYRLGDASMAAMVKPFWVDRGFGPTEIGLFNTTLGIAVTILGALVGGWYCTTRGIFRGLWVLGLMQAFSNLGYAGAALGDERWTVYAASLVENLTGGLGTAAQLALLTYLCDRQHAATQYAALTAMFGLTRALAGAASGYGASHLGFAGFFALTFALSAPAFFFLPQVKARLR